MIGENVKRILKELPPAVLLVAATKDRGVNEIEEAVAAGVTTVGENYVQDAAGKFEAIARSVRWHMIGHLQKNKAKAAAALFDMIETLDSPDLARALDKACARLNKTMPVLIEINSGAESQKSGIMPDEAQVFIEQLRDFRNLKPMGLMTMGPFSDEPENCRACFRRTKELFDAIARSSGKSLDWRYLSMGMSSSYRVALAEGANIVRIGTAIFGPRSRA